MSDQPYIMALDISSTNLGFVLYHGVVLDHGEQALAGDIAERCRRAYNVFHTLLDRYPQVDCLAIEAPVARFASAVIAQSRVAGAIFALAGQRTIPVVEVSPAAAKRALTGHGNASKEEMQRAARCYGVSGEHAADALGVALACAGKVEVVAA